MAPNDLPPLPRLLWCNIVIRVGEEVYDDFRALLFDFTEEAIIFVRDDNKKKVWVDTDDLEGICYWGNTTIYAVKGGITMEIRYET